MTVKSGMVHDQARTGSPFAIMPALGWTVRVEKLSSAPCLLRLVPGCIRLSDVDFLAKMRAWHVVSHLGAHALSVAGVD